MKLELNRLCAGNDSTIGAIKVNNAFHSFTCEDESREKKVMNETRIPAGTYEIKLRNEGGMNGRYANKYPGFHKGMLWLQDVPNFEWVYIHIGNDDDDTSGCILVGYNAVTDTINGGGFIGKSADAYKSIYKMITKAMDDGETVQITINDE